MQELLMDRQREIYDVIQLLWDSLESDVDLFVPLIASRKHPGKKVLFAEMKDKTKLVRAFAAYVEAEKYIRDKCKEFNVNNLSVYRMSHSALYSAIRVGSINGDMPIECILTVFDVDGNIYDMEDICINNIN